MQEKWRDDIDFTFFSKTVFELGSLKCCHTRCELFCLTMSH